MYVGGSRLLLVDMNVWSGRIARALSVRVWFFSLVFGVCAYVVVSLVWHGVDYWLMWLLAAGAYVLAIFNDGQMVTCSACGKRVKLGADRCHHCGYQPTT